MISIVVACGGGIFTTTIVSDEIKEILRKAGIPCRVSPSTLTQIANVRDADLIVVTGKFGTDQKNVDNIPIIAGMSLLTGIGKDEFTKTFIAKVQELAAAKT
jgi:PTS system galactitol-specific IIB component